jgi:hypothetical protein
MAIAEDVALLLQSEGFGTLGINIFAYKWGSSEDQVLVMPGVGSSSLLKDLYRNPSVQILIRGKRNVSHTIPYSLAERIYGFLSNLPENVSVNGNSYKGFDPESEIGVLGEDENERPVFSLNFNTYI